MVSKEKIHEFLKGVKPPYLYNSHKFIPGKSSVYYSGPWWDNVELEYALDALLNGKWLVAGENVSKFENEFSKKFNVKYSHMVNSGSSANLILITSLKKYYNWDDGDEIIVSPVGFPTTISVICQNNLKPVFVDIEMDTLNFDLKLLEKKITKKTKAIFVSPVLGNSPDMDILLELCKKYNLKLIGDNCDSLGTKWNGKYLNEYYVAFSNSFYPAHHITTGEGGMVCTNNKHLKKLFVSFSWWGRACDCVGNNNLKTNGVCDKRFSKWLDNYDGIVDHKYVFNNMGYNLKPMDMQGSIGFAQLQKFELIDKNRKKYKSQIEKIFIDNISDIRGVSYNDKSDVSWFGVPFICEKVGLKHKLVAYLESNKIQTRNYFSGNILLHNGFKHLDDYKKYPNANKVLDDVFFIGCAPNYTEGIIDYIDDIVKKGSKL